MTMISLEVVRISANESTSLNDIIDILIHSANESPRYISIVIFLPGLQPYSSILNPIFLFHFRGYNVRDVARTGKGMTLNFTELLSLLAVKIYERKITVNEIYQPQI